MKDVSIIDAVLGYCALHGILPSDPSISNPPFREVMTKLTELCANHMEYVAISWHLRQLHPICHAECHVMAIRQFFEQCPGWKLGDHMPSIEIEDEDAPAKKERKPGEEMGKILQFPTSNTRH